MAAEIAAVAARISVILPWGSLLSTVVKPEIDSLRHIARLCFPGATVEIIFSYDEQRDARLAIPLGNGLEDHITTKLPLLYAQAELPIVASEQISQRELCEYQTSWANRLAFGRPRRVWRLRAQNTATPGPHS